jgi:hypothetical protein
MEDLMKKFYQIMVFVLGIFIWCSSAQSAYIDFESIPSSTLVRDQFQSMGVRITSTDNVYGGLVYSEGSYGVSNYGNSPTQIMDIGSYGATTTIMFVEPLLPENVIGASSVSFVLGDGNLDQESFSISYRSPEGSLLLGPTTYTTSTSGLWFSMNEDDLGGLIGYIDLYLEPGSQSGVTLDDLTFHVVPIPAAIWLLGTGLLGIVGLRRKMKK